MQQQSDLGNSAEKSSKDLNELFFSDKKSDASDLYEFEMLLSKSSEKKGKSPIHKNYSPRVLQNSSPISRIDSLSDKQSIDKLADEIESLMRIQKNFKNNEEFLRDDPQQKGKAGFSSSNRFGALNSKFRENQLFEIEEVSIENSTSIM